MDPRVRWQTLQAHVSAARFALKMGDLERARQEVETALSIDPEFLAARVLQDQLKTPETSTVPPAPEVFQAAPPKVPAPPAVAQPASLAASAAKLARIEEKVKQRVESRARLHPIQSSSREQRAPSPEQRAPSREIRAPRPEPRLAGRSRRLRVGAVAAAGVAFAVAVGSNVRVREPQLLFSRATATTASLVDVARPLPLDFSATVDQPVPIERVDRPAPARVVEPPPPTPVRVMVTAPIAPTPVAPTASRPAQTIATPLPVQVAPINSVVTDSPPPALLPRAVDERALVEETLTRYRRAYNRLDARSAKEVYPAVNAPALARAFDGLQSQSLQFDECDIDVRGALASVTCRGTSRFVPKIGNRDPQVEPRVWDFTLRKDDGDWKIENARAGR